MSVNMIAASLRCSPATLMAEASRPCKRCAALTRRRNCQSSLRFVKNFVDQRLKTQLVANAVVDLVNLKIPTSAVLLLVRFFQPIQTFFFLAKSKIDRRERCWTNVLLLLQLFELAQSLLSFRAFSGDGISVAEESLIPGTGIRSFGFLQFRDYAVRVAFFKEREA